MTPGFQAEPEVRRTLTSTAFTVERFFTRSGDDPYDALEWERRTAVIADESGNAFFEQKDVEIPAAWSQTATNIVVSKYFRGPLGSRLVTVAAGLLLAGLGNYLGKLRPNWFVGIRTPWTISSER